MKKYYKLIMSVKASEGFVEGRYVFTPAVTKEAVLHENQKNNEKILAKIKRTMWEELISEKGWNFLGQRTYQKLANFNIIPIAHKSAPITYHY